jgi:hypothetical protein
VKAMTIIRPETLVRWHRAVFAVIGAGHPGTWEAGRRSMQVCGC